MSAHDADAAARTAALDVGRSFIVQAPAGSGKTELLTRRFLAALASARAPEEVVAITFTRKAASEMRSRILAALDDDGAAGPTADLGAAVRDADRRHGWELRAHPARLRVQTIDALCASLAHQVPLLSRLGAASAVRDDATALHREAARRCLAWLADGGAPGAALRDLVAHVGDRLDLCVALLTDLLARRDQWLRHLLSATPGALDDGWRTELETSLAATIARRLAAARAAFPEPEAAALVPLAREAATVLRNAGSPSPIAALTGLAALPEAAVSALSAWRGVATLLLTGVGAWRRQVRAPEGFGPGDTRTPDGLRDRARKEAMGVLLERLGRHEALRAALAEVRLLPDPAFTAAEWTAMRALGVVLPLAAAELRLVFRDHATVDFVEIMGSALAALGSERAPTDLLLHLDQQIRHLLVDEFQDTSRTQLLLLERLTSGWEPDDGRSLFLVGDPMQSIYRFREADVTLFRQVQQRGLGTLAPEPLVLSRNFRAAPPLVDWINATFARVFAAPDPAEPDAVVYTPAIAGRPEATGGADTPPVVVHPFDERDDAAEAETVVAIVEDVRRRDPRASIGVLVRSRRHLDAIVRALRRRDLPFAAQDVDPLGARPAVHDLLALATALLELADRGAWLAVLRAPWCGLTRADLRALAADAGARTCWELLHDPERLAALSADGRARCLAFRHVLEPALAARGTRPLRALVEGTWIALGGPACVDAHGLADACDLFAALDALTLEGVTTPELIGVRLGQVFARPDPRADGTLQLMTVHKAKGLEFDVVVLPGLGRWTQGEDPSLLSWLETADGLLLAPLAPAEEPAERPVARFVARLDRRARSLETVRLVYVAATRARRELHLLGHAPADADGRRTPDGRSLLAVTWPAVADAFGDLPARPAVPLDPPRIPPTVRRLPATWRRPEPAPPAVALARDTPRVDDGGPLSFRWVGDVARRVGVVVHDALCRIAREGLDAWTPGHVRDAAPRLRAALAAELVPHAELDAATARAVAILEAALADPRGRWLLDAHDESASELRVSGVVDGVIVHASVDRTFVADGVRWIVDYKTGGHEGGAVDAFLDRERERYGLQLARYGALLGALDGRPQRFGLYYPHLPGGWRSW